MQRTPTGRDGIDRAMSSLAVRVPPGRVRGAVNNPVEDDSVGVRDRCGAAEDREN